MLSGSLLLITSRQGMRHRLSWGLNIGLALTAEILVMVKIKIEKYYVVVYNRLTALRSEEVLRANSTKSDQSYGSNCPT